MMLVRELKVDLQRRNASIAGKNCKKICIYPIRVLNIVRRKLSLAYILYVSAH